MRNLCVYKSERKDFIKKVKKNKDGTYNLKFADGKVIKNLMVNETVFKSIESIINRQVDYALSNYSEFEDYKDQLLSLYKLTLGYSFGTIFSANIASGLLEAPFVIPLAIGLLSVSPSFPSFVGVLKSLGKLSDLDKFAYLRENEDIISSYKDYDNSLDGVKKSTKKYLNESEHPFSVVDIDKFTQKDLEKIVDNIENYSSKKEKSK